MRLEAQEVELERFFDKMSGSLSKHLRDWCAVLGVFNCPVIIDLCLYVPLRGSWVEVTAIWKRYQPIATFVDNFSLLDV